MNLLGVILSGGKSSRMGSDKGLVQYKGKPLVEYSIDLLKPICEEIIISTNSSQYLDYGYRTIPDIIKEIGPIGGVFSVMQMIKSDFYFFVSCDTPYNSKELIQKLLKYKHMADVVVPMHSGEKIEPLFALYSNNVFPIVKEQIEKKNFKLMDLLDECKTYYYTVPEKFIKQNPDLFKNINSSKDV